MSPRRLAYASLEDGAVIAFFETSTEPSLEECQALHRLAAGGLLPFRRPTKFDCVKTFPGPHTEVGYRV